MIPSTYYVEKATGTFADDLLAYGLAALLEGVLRDGAGRQTVTVRDAGSVYAIELAAPIGPDSLEIEWFCDLPFIQTDRQTPPKGWLGEVVDYGAERERNSAYFVARKQLPQAAKRPGATVDEFPELGALAGLKPRADWEILAQINQMQGIVAYAEVLRTWAECRACFADLVRLTLGLFVNPVNDVDTAIQRWRQLKKQHGLKAKDTVTPVQITNPSMGKGLNRPKTDRADKPINPDSFWLLEYLKFWGMRKAALPRVVRLPKPQPRGPSDRKTYVLRPRNLSLETLDRVFAPFNAVMWPSTAVKMDVLAALRFVDVFLEQWLAGALGDIDWGEQPDDFVGELAVAFYKDMGSASSVLNLSEIGLPEWMDTHDSTSATRYRALLEEHRRVVDSLHEDHGTEYRLLQLYRNFLSGRSLRAFFEFCAGYAGVTLARMDKGQWSPRFSTDNLEVLLMAHDAQLSPILTNKGFRHVAAAIRRSTITPQFFKAQGKAGPYVIRYGLGNELLRHAAYPEQFVQALSVFLHEYNRETGQIFERYGAHPPVRRATVTTEDIEAVIGLVDLYGSETVANLLVAFGYAREPRDTDAGPGTPEETEETPDPDTE